MPLTQLCSTELGRSYLREKQVYLILRALDSGETEDRVQRCCLELISILIGEEPQPGMRDLDKVVISPEMRQELERTSRETETADSVCCASSVGSTVVKTES